jgi:hypothetical protein
MRRAVPAKMKGAFINEKIRFQKDGRCRFRGHYGREPPACRPGSRRVYGDTPKNMAGFSNRRLFNASFGHIHSEEHKNAFSATEL